MLDIEQHFTFVIKYPLCFGALFIIVAETPSLYFNDKFHILLDNSPLKIVSVDIEEDSTLSFCR